VWKSVTDELIGRRRKATYQLCFMTLLVWAPLACPAQNQTPRPPAVPSSTAQRTLKTFLQNYVRAQALEEDKTTRYLAAFFDLNGDGIKEAIVHITGRDWCGTGGCHTLILARDGSSWRVVTDITITRPPIRVLSHTSNGWRSISVWVQGGGIQPGYEAELRFDGKTYPGNPSMAPARPLEGKVAGVVVVPSSKVGTPLYP
jgi:hypothetical protein